MINIQQGEDCRRVAGKQLGQHIQLLTLPSVEVFALSQGLLPQVFASKIFEGEVAYGHGNYATGRVSGWSGGFLRVRFLVDPANLSLG